MIAGAICFTITVVVAVAGYVIAGWSFLDAVYMVIITVFGVGFGEVRPITSPALRVFTIFVIVAGSVSVVYMVGGFVQLLTEGEIKQALEVRRMIREIELLEDHVIVCGFGRMGQILCSKLKTARMPFVVLDNNPERVTEAEELGYLVYTGSATDEMALDAVGIRRARVLATVLPSDADNVFITLTAREMNANLQILARGEYPSTEKKLRLAGADHVVLPATIGAMRMSHLITHPATLDFLDRNDGGSTLNELLSQFGLRMDELEITPTSSLAGGTVSNVEVRGRGNFIVVAVRQADGNMVTSPPDNMKLNPGDTVIVLGHKGDIPQFAQSYALQRQIRYRGARVR
ncbi:MAG: potassium channel protein [Cyanobacteria bacterium]|nr:potassium channel protein [Cyanobacteriota bacterium]MDW8199990.1 potassium channel protein [Cyanobacteriota bacterium SKYGB_h_bin112]